ncbi:hypothetical protein GCM10011611_38050 [Aliidongia dinghuensis]|uniref:Uncharacterized protein n=1 Tax=Aliidongia dinghuensis TaxID=1867774 RepID=A0A8J2YVL3_9PROT|nr:hypothetical protein [Aliidongia dinghuensis]GGF28409.1 hypothetical protein GCM10011611_38050 [Aliidongia dinghuensis]
MSKENSGFAAFYAACAEHHAEISQTTRGLLIGAAIVLAMVALLLQALVAHPLPPLTSDLVGQAAFNGFEPMAAPMSPADNQPTVDANAILMGMFLAVGVVTGLFASVAFLVDCTARVGAFAHRLSTGRKLPEAEGGD